MFYFKKSIFGVLLSISMIVTLSVNLTGQCIEDDASTLDDWNTIGEVSIVGDTSILISTADGVGAESITNIELMLGIPSGSLNTLVNSMSSTVGGVNDFFEGSAIKREIVICPGTEVCFDYQLFTEETPNFITAYTDVAFVALVNEGLMTIIDLLDPALSDSNTADYTQESGKMTFCHTFNSIDTGYLAIGILDEEDGGGVTDLFLNDLTLDNCCTIEAEDIEVRDPCACGNPNNLRLDDGRFLFQDTLIVTSSLPVTLTMNDGNLLDMFGNPIPINTSFTLDPATGEYKLEIFTESGASTNIEVSNGLYSAPFMAGSCTECEVVPTMGEWGLMSLGLLLMIFGVASIKQRALISVRN